MSEDPSGGHVGSLDAGAGFVVDPAGLDIIATALQGQRDDVVAITAGLRRLPTGSHAVLGEAGTHSAYLNFFDAWVGELETIAGGLAELTDRMRATSKTYHGVDRTEEHRFGSGPPPDSSPSPDPGAAASRPVGAVGRALDGPPPQDDH
ncbi:MAG: hypothetical protein ACT4NY_33155 [Pseudonocardiales bacterium]